MAFGSRLTVEGGHGHSLSATLFGSKGDHSHFEIGTNQTVIMFVATRLNLLV